MIGSGWLWVDLFFVLSGCVIAKGYCLRLNTWQNLRSYAVKRWARLYPLHIFTLLLWLVIALSMPAIVTWAKQALSAAPAASISSAFSVPSWDLAMNLLMLHGLGTVDGLNFNFPSWSISVEMAVYLIWAGLWWFCQSSKKAFGIALAIATSSWAYLYCWGAQENIGYMQDLGFFRCLLGFSLGTAIPMLADLCSLRWRAFYARYLSLIAIFFTFAVFFYANSVPRFTYIAPLIFAVLVFSLYWDEGPLAFLLKHPLLVRLGALSYSIYLIHGPLLLIFKPLASQFPSPIGDLLLIPYAAGLIGVAHISYYYFEVPSRDFITSKISKSTPKRS
jgi:peptidoglycan/LPS O-acetylase OafA/YrhL